MLCLLNLRNVPRDQVLGAPAQRLMSRQTRGVLPVAKKLLTSKTLKSRHVSSRLELKRQQQKAYYDQHAKPLPPLNPKQVVRLQTDKGYKKVGVVKRPAAQPRSYIVEAGGKEYRRNRRHLLAVPEPVPVQPTSAPQQPPAANKQDGPSFSTVGSPSPHQSPSKTPAKSSVPQEAPLRTLVRSQAPIKSFLS